MDTENVKYNKTYKKCKTLVKKWEKEFKSINNRIPSKFDIKEAPAKVRSAYKTYFHIKSAILENSVDIDSCSVIDESLSNSPESSFNIETLLTDNSVSPKSDTLTERLPNEVELNQLLSSKPKFDKISETSTKSINPFSDTFTKKLFQKSKFSLRNPRKSQIVKSITQNKIEELDTENGYKIKENVHIIESNLNNKGPANINENILSSNNYSSIDCLRLTHNSMTLNSKSIDVKEKVNNHTVKQYNERWLERATGISIQVENTPKTFEKFGISNISLQYKEDVYADFVENSESENDDISDKIKPALKKRKLVSDILENDNKIRSPQKKGKTKCRNLKPVSNESLNASDKLEGICTDEPSQENTNIKSKKLSKVIIIENEENPPTLDEFTVFGVEKDLLPRFGKMVPLKENKITKEYVDPGNRLEQKIKNGTLNDNFVRINVEKKVFVRGKKSLNYSKFKKQQFKNKKALHGGMEFPESGKVICYKCGGSGHMSRFCVAHKGDQLLPLNMVDKNDIPTLEEMDKNKTDNFESTSDHNTISAYKASVIPESFLKLLSEYDNQLAKIKPVYSDINSVDTNEIYDALKMFGHNSFRYGQEEAIKRILCGSSTLLLLSTGGGKSLCYQLPAYIYRKKYQCITLVISPLVSLMEDQVLSMPDFLKAGCLHTNQPPTHRKRILQLLKDGELSILLISPEALISGDGSTNFKGLFKLLPPIAFVCIDEAHCVSQWSHNFRPSYLMISRVLREKLKIETILGLTATASQTTIKSIISHINIPDGFSGVIRNPELPKNLILSISQEMDKDRSLITLLSSEPISSFNSIIIYCIRRDECERIAAILRSSLQEPGLPTMEKRGKKRKLMSYVAEAYHAGLSAAQRKNIQTKFMDGSLRIIVATVAFGMGIDKSDIRCIIHYDMPSSFESYVQEVGRAGRDGKEAHCHVFVNNNKKDKNELLKHIYSNSIDRHVIRKLLEKVFQKCNCKNLHISDNAETSIKCKGHEVAIPIDETVEELDLQAEVIVTLLCYLELHPQQIVKVLNNTYTMCKIAFYGDIDSLNNMAQKCPPLQWALKFKNTINNKFERKKCNILEFPVVEVAAEIGWESGITKYKLKNLEWIVDENGISRKSSLKVEFHTLGFRIRAPGDLTSLELDKMLDYLHETVITQEKSRLQQLEEISITLHKLGSSTIHNLIYLPSEERQQKSNELKSIIQSYFQREDVVDINIETRPLNEEHVISDVRALISSYRDCKFSGRSIARIFQGISSPNYPAIIWGRCKFWRSHINEDFNGLVRIATQQILDIKLK